MFDIGWMELMLIGIVALIVVGPKDLPGMFRTVGKFVGKARSMAREFQRSMEQAADETGLKEATKDLQGLNDLGLNSATKTAKSFAKNMMGDDEDGEPGATSKKPAKAKPAKEAVKKPAKKPEKAPAKKPAAKAASNSAKPAAKPKKPAAKPAAKPRKSATRTAAK